MHCKKNPKHEICPLSDLCEFVKTSR
ncbi:MAG: hypothetical protein ACUVTL_08065 [Thermoproteota archaeon]